MCAFRKLFHSNSIPTLLDALPTHFGINIRCISKFTYRSGIAKIALKMHSTWVMFSFQHQNILPAERGKVRDR